LLSFPENRVFAFWRQTDKQTDEQMDSTDALSRFRYRERRLKNSKANTWFTNKCDRNSFTGYKTFL